MAEISSSSRPPLTPRSAAGIARSHRPVAKNEPVHYPEFAVRSDVIGRYFCPPLASSTFYDLVNKGKIVPLKGIRGFYKLNKSLRRLGLREGPRLPVELPARTPEEIVEDS